MRAPVYGWEFLRGSCALAVAAYHCLTWSGIATLYNWGLYAVYIFFVISGAVLYYNYRDLTDIGSFLYKRVARIAPLYLLCVAITLAGKGIVPGWRHVLNVSLLFGFSNPGEITEVAGGWSIGIEFALYALFPALLVFTRSLIAIVITAAVLLLVRIGTTELSVGDSLDASWGTYTQVGSFLFFFFAGMAIPPLIEKLRTRWPLYVVGACATVALFALPMSAPLLKGWTGTLYTLMCVVVVAFFYFVRLPGSKLLGKLSYGLYLLHPIVWVALKRLGVPLSVATALTIPCAGIAALLVLKFYETPVKRWILSLRKPAWS